MRAHYQCAFYRHGGDAQAKSESFDGKIPVCEVQNPKQAASKSQCPDSKIQIQLLAGAVKW
jgi:hypothetical protein